MKICITGYTYIRKNLFEVWDYYKEKENLYFILPRKWPAKAGTIVYYPSRETDLKVYKTTALFWHSKYPIIRGLLKGWMPFLMFKLIYLRLKGVKLLFTASEPNILTTVLNALIARVLGMKHIFNFWDVVPSAAKTSQFKKYVYDNLIRTSIALSHGAVCGNRKSTDILSGYGGKIKIVTFPTSGLDHNYFSKEVKPTFRQELKLDDKFIFLFAGVFNKQKGVDYLIEAFSQIVKEIPDARLLLVGTGPEEESLKSLVLSFGLGNQVTFMKWIEHRKMAELFASCDVFMYPSVCYKGSEEQFGYAMAEAMLIEKPVIATRTGSIAEVIKDRENGILVPEKDTLKLAESMLKLAKSRGLREEFGIKGRQYIIDNFSHQIIADKFYRLFKEL